MIGFLTQWAIRWAELGWLPDSACRLGIRALCRQRLRQIHADDPATQAAAQAQFLAEASQASVALVPAKANEQHYELPTEWFELLLGPRRKYSCGLWPSTGATLGEAEDAALEQTCRHADLVDGHDVLDLGCGWGSLTLWIAERYPRCRITAVSNSTSQRAYIEQVAAARGWADRIQVLTADMNTFRPPRKYERIVSVEMFEHLRNHREFLRRIAGWLTPDGVLFVHVFCHRKQAYPFTMGGPADWMARHFFTGGMMPSADWLEHASDHMRVTARWTWNGQHYARTLEAWLDQLDCHPAAARQMLAKTYGRNQADLWLGRWRLFLMASAELFKSYGGAEWHVVHCRFELPQPADTVEDFTHRAETTGCA